MRDRFAGVLREFFINTPNSHAKGIGLFVCHDDPTVKHVHQFVIFEIGIGRLTRFAFPNANTKIAVQTVEILISTPKVYLKSR